MSGSQRWRSCEVSWRAVDDNGSVIAKVLAHFPVRETNTSKTLWAFTAGDTSGPPTKSHGLKLQGEGMQNRLSRRDRFPSRLWCSGSTVASQAPGEGSIPFSRFSRWAFGTEFDGWGTYGLATLARVRQTSTGQPNFRASLMQFGCVGTQRYRGVEIWISTPANSTCRAGSASPG